MPIPLDQDWIITPMQNLGYKADVEGVCHGMVVAFIQAALIRQLPLLYERSLLISMAGGESFADTILTFDKEIQQDIHAFFNIIEIAQNTRQYPHLFPVETQVRQDFRISYPLTSSKSLEEADICSMPVFSGLYNKNDLFDYFYSFNEVYNRYQFSDPITFILRNRNHAVGISVDADKNANKWVYCETSEFEKINPKYITSISDLPRNIIKSMSDNVCESSSFASLITGTKRDEEQLNLMLKEWQSTKTYRSIHDPLRAKLSALDSIGVSWAEIAIIFDDSTTFDALLDNNVLDMNSFASNGESFLQLVELHGSSKINAVCSKYIMDPGKLISAVDQRKIEDIQILLQDDRYDVNYLNEDGDTALILACARDDAKIVKLLLQHKKIDVNLFTDEIPLGNCLFNSSLKCLKLLLNDSRIDVNKTFKNMTPLFYAAKNGEREIVKLLLKKDADMYISTPYSIDEWIKVAKESNAETAMTAFLENNNLLILQNKKTEISIMPEEIARIMGHNEIADLIENAKAKKVDSYFNDEYPRSSAFFASPHSSQEKVENMPVEDLFKKRKYEAIETPYENNFKKPRK